MNLILGVKLMKLTFYNDCGYIVHLSVESEGIIKVEPHNMVVVNCEKNNSIICIKRNILSFKKQNKYTLVLETKYKVTNICDNDIFRITHEKVWVECNVYYDKLFLNSKTARCTVENNNVLGEEEIKKKFHNSQIRYRIFISPFECLTGFAILLIILGIILGCRFGWKLVFVYFPIAYLFLIGVDWTLERINQFIFHKAFNMEDEETEFHHFFENEFIMRYYSNSK